MPTNPKAPSDSEITAAVKDLRLRLGETQQSLATRLGTAISTMVRYETNRPPSGQALVQFMRLADSHGDVDLGEIFQRAISAELGYAVPRFDEEAAFQLLPGERPFFEAFARAMRSPAHKKQREQLERVLAPMVAGNARNDSSAAQILGLLGEVRRRINAGESDEQIVREIPNWPAQSVQVFITAQRGMDQLSKAAKEKQ